MSDISIWGYSLPISSLLQSEVEYLARLPKNLPAVDWVWKEMNRVWSHFNLDNTRELEKESLGKFYSHPVWLMNGIFSALDPDSVSHRNSIAEYLYKSKATLIADYGGGFGELARMMTNTIPDANVFIIDPFISKSGKDKFQSEKRIKFRADLALDMKYDAIIAQDVLEHLADPIKVASKIADALREGGQAIFANCFYPVIQCHLPSTFHLRHTFPLVMKALGLQYLGSLNGATHAQVFKRVGPLNFSKAKRTESLSIFLGPVLNQIKLHLPQIRKLVEAD